LILKQNCSNSIRVSQLKLRRLTKNLETTSKLFKRSTILFPFQQVREFSTTDESNDKNIDKSNDKSNEDHNKNKNSIPSTEEITRNEVKLKNSIPSAEENFKNRTSDLKVS